MTLFTTARLAGARLPICARLGRQRRPADNRQTALDASTCSEAAPQTGEPTLRVRP